MRQYSVVYITVNNVPEYAIRYQGKQAVITTEVIE